MESAAGRTRISAGQGALFERAIAPAGSPLPPARLLVVLAHPDDEVLALGARLERLTEARLLTVTDGAPRDGADARDHGFASVEAYAAARGAELGCALAHAGLSPSVAAPCTAIPHVADQEASRHLVALTQGILAVIQEFRPEVILTHPYEGGHPDHDACAFAVHTAVHMVLRLRHGAPPRKYATGEPLLIEAPFYHADGHGGMRTGAFLDEERFPARVLPLSTGEQRNKRARLACFGSQAETLAQFGVEWERFRVAPRYDFTEPPHPGRLFYEGFSWGVTGAQFRTLVSEAETTLLGVLGAPRRLLQPAPHPGTLR